MKNNKNKTDKNSINEKNKSEKPQSGKSSFSQILLMNVIFWCFCIIIPITVRASIKNMTGLIYFFTILAIGFTAVSIFDYIYDRFSSETDDI